MDKKEKYRKIREYDTERTQRFVYEYLKEHPCIDCGETNPIKLEFDHVRGEKKCHVSSLMRQRTVIKIKTEIEKCEVVCANCHRVRTMTRGQWYRYRFWLEEQGRQIADHPLPTE